MSEPIRVRGVMKPIPTLYKPLMSVDVETHEPYKATVERSDNSSVQGGDGSSGRNGLRQKCLKRILIR